MKKILLLLLTGLLTSCGFHPQGQTTLAPQLQRLYLKAPDPYGFLVRNLQQNLKASHVQLVTNKAEANAVLSILQDSSSEELVSVSVTNQTRLISLKVIVVFDITDANDRVLVAPQTLAEVRNINIQSNQILGGSNEAALFYQQMRRSLAYAIMNRIASRDVTNMLQTATKPS